MTVLDRGRAGQIARDLAISSVQLHTVRDQAQHQCETANRHCVVLWAEELTIGHRLDVTVVKEKAQVGKLDWRSLMHRRIAFDMEPAVKKILKQVTGDKSLFDHFHVETSFQVVTRSMPLLGVGNAGDGARQVEAIADEALVTWDGTPLAALARQDLDENRPHQGPRLPFTRSFSLEVDGTDRPPPLRYGVGYAFAMRSVFVGGGSLPPQFTGPATAPTRFHPRSRPGETWSPPEGASCVTRASMRRRSCCRSTLPKRKKSA